MGHTASVNRQRSSTRSSLSGEPVDATAAPHESHTPVQMQALYRSHGRPDMAFISNETENMPDGLPELLRTYTVRNHLSLKKTSLKLQRANELQHSYKLEFQFDAMKPCRVSVYLVATETIDGDTGDSSVALVYANKTPVLTQHFPSGRGHVFALHGEGAKKEGNETHEHPLPLLGFSMYDPDELQYKAEATQFPLIIVLEVISEGNRPQSQSTFCTFRRKNRDCWDLQVLKQKVLVHGLTYELQEIYGIDGSVAAAPQIESNNATGENDSQADRSQTSKSAREIPEGAECIICLCEPRNTTILPCRHMCLCSECADSLRKSSSTCPVCRTHIEALLQIFVEAKETSATEAR